MNWLQLVLLDRVVRRTPYWETRRYPTFDCLTPDPYTDE